MSATEGEEPLSGVQGKGTADKPFDQGNASEATPAETSGAEGTGTEPISGAQGKGTVDEPYDKGNTSANRNTHSSSLIDNILKKKGKSTVIDTATGAPPVENQGSGTVAEPSVKETAAIAKEKHDLEASQQNAQVTEPTAKSVADTPAAESNPAPSTMPTSAAAAAPAITQTPASPVAESKGKEPERGRGKEFESYSKPREAERSVSPGTLPDGRHAETSGDKGQGYTPPGKLGKLGAKMGFGHH